MSAHISNKGASRLSRKSKPEEKVKSISHMYLNNKKLEEIKIPARFNSVKVLYLHNNQIQSITGLDCLRNLTHLYLQWNRIKEIDNLNCLISLQKLYLGYNMIRCLENIERLHNLKELHIEKQDLEEAEFRFDFFTLKSIARNLEVLNISKLSLKSLEPVSILLRLKHLIANDNCFEDAKEIGIVLGRMVFLEKADLEGCPAQKDTHFREKITAGSYNLQFLNGKFITPYNRAFIKRFEEIKNERRTKSETDTKCVSKPKNKVKKSTHSLQLQNTNEELSFRAWNSLNSIQKPVRRMNRKETNLRPKSECSLEGKHIDND